MFRRSKQNTPQIENAIAKAANFEIQLEDMSRRGHKRSWLIAYASAFMAIILALSYVLILPLQKIERYMLIADPYIGLARVARLDDDEAFIQLVSSQPILKTSLTNYMLARESFDFPSTAYHDYFLVNWLSTPKVFDEYNRLYQKDNPDEPLKVFGRERAVRIGFVSTELRRIGSEKDIRHEATVRFQRFTYEKNGGKTKLYDSKIATIEFTFDRSLLSDPNQRANNPLGFLVTAYRVDNDSSAPPPPPDVAQPVQSTFAQPAGQVQVGAQQSSASQSPQAQQVPQFGAPAAGPASSPQPQSQYPAQPAVQSQPTVPVGQAPNQVNGVRN